MPTKARHEKKAPTVQQYMTPAPWTIGREQPLMHAERMMREHGIRHLPVLDGGKIVGMLSERELHLVESIPGVRPGEVTVEEAMMPGIYRVAPDAPLAFVAEEMSERKLGSAVVMQGEHVVGVFTTIDALRALSDAFRRRRRTGTA